MDMQQQIAVVTLGVTDLKRSKRFYQDGFGWRPAFETDEIAFYQMNGLVLATWLKAALEQDADVVLFIYRPSRYGQVEEHEKNLHFLQKKTYVSLG